MSVALEGKPHYILNASCASRLGTVAAVSGFLASRRCYITDMQQFDDIRRKSPFLIPEHGENAANIAHNLDHFLIQTVDGRALQLFHLVPRGNGLEAWRSL